MVRTYKGTQRRSVSREQEFADDLNRSSAALAGLAAPVSTPSRSAIRREAAVLLADKLAELPEHYRRAIVLHHIEGLSIAEVAKRLDRSPEATNSLLARALVKLRVLMKGDA
jgi:RNA polymerase sigma-70 factor (ECF subfamily)